jgi:hypothetical protein
MRRMENAFGGSAGGGWVPTLRYEKLDDGGL